MIKAKTNALSGRMTRKEIRYCDNDRNPVSRDKATWAVFRELDTNGNILFEAQGFIE